MFVLTADQRDSRRLGDMVPGTLQALRRIPTVLPFERTVGDEIQGVLDSSESVLQSAMLLYSQGSWHVGIGAGTVNIPLGASARESRGQAFLLAREAVEQAKSQVPSLVVEGANSSVATDANALWRLLATIWERRSGPGWEAVFAVVQSESTQKVAAEKLGITQQALSARLRSSMWSAEVAVHPLARQLLSMSQGKDND